MEKVRILIADDEERIVNLISDFLCAAGYETVTAADGQAALDILTSDKDIKLAIIDIMMPEIDGWTVTRKLREMSDIPVIMLSARSEEFDMLNGFESGADEYVTKPFSPAVLVKRVEALIKRSSAQKKETDSKSGGLVIDQNAYTATLDGEVVELTFKEFELLSHLYRNAGRVLTRDQLLDAVWDYDYVGDSRTVDSHIARIRIKLGNFGSTHLKTIYGMGYKFEL